MDIGKVLKRSSNGIMEMVECDGLHRWLILVREPLKTKSSGKLFRPTTGLRDSAHPVYQRSSTGSSDLSMRP